MCSYLNNGQYPFFVNVNKKNKEHNDKATIISLFDEANGNYIMGVVTAIAPGYEARKMWLVTFNFSGKIIDFPGNDYIVKDHNPLDNLKGQRIDTKYQITPDGKFKKLSEVCYQPQIYSPDMLLDKTTNIRERNKKWLNKQNK